MAASAKYFISRVISAAITLVIVMLIISTLFFTLSEEQVETQINEQIRQETMGLEDMTEEEIENYREQRLQELREVYGLDQPVAIRILQNTYNSLTLNLGRSYQMTVAGTNDVSGIIMARLPRTILLFTTAAVIYVLLGLFVGLKAAQVAGGKLDKFLSVFGITASSMPMWWLGMLAILIFSYGLGWFPSAAWPFPEAEGLEYVGGVLYRMALPLMVIVFNLFGARAWATRNMVVDVLQNDYIMAARAKGVPESKVIYGHTLKTAAPPVLTSALLALLMSIGGAMVTEVVFNWPGMGRLLYNAIHANDIPVVSGIVFITAFLVIIGYLISDLLYGIIDPRVELGSKGTR